VLDNLITAMTGFQPHPGTGIRITGEKTKRILIEETGKGVGVDFIKVFDPYDLEETIKILIEAVNYNDGPTLLVARRSCSLLATRAAKKKGETIQIYTIDQEKCNNCRLCTSSFGCPAFTIDEEENAISIVKSACTGCGVCAYICPENAIVELNE
jgi:indolepyruvate ferredoxin oxidoreductase alpha subunit